MLHCPLHYESVVLMVFTQVAIDIPDSQICGGTVYRSADSF